MFIPVEVRPSTIFGRGLFPLRDVKKGTVVCSFTTDARTITEAEYLAAIEAKQFVIVRTGTRYVGKYFTYTDDTDSDLNFFNHSFNPNLLVHCGVVIALDDIRAETELTIDYRYLIDATDIGIYNDSATAQAIRGFSPKRTLLETSKRLVTVLESLGDDWQG
jgi:hypothetical protein